jgi:hypothetical protein
MMSACVVWCHLPLCFTRIGLVEDLVSQPHCRPSNCTDCSHCHHITHDLNSQMSQRNPISMHDQRAKLVVPLISTFRSRLIASGISNLHKVLAPLKEDIDARYLLLNLSLNNSQYCSFCSPRKEFGLCGRICPLIGPVGTEKGGWSEEHAVGGWADWVLALIRSYQTIREDVIGRGDDVSLEKLHVWQGMAEELRVLGLNRSEVQAKHDWEYESASLSYR